MPISTVFDPDKYIESAEEILEAWLLDFYPAPHIITFTPPSAPEKPTVWLLALPEEEREVRTRDGRGGTVQGIELRYSVNLLALDRETARGMAQTFRRHAVLGSASALGSAGLRYVEATRFQEIPENSQPRAFRRAGILSFVVELKK